MIRKITIAILYFAMLIIGIVTGCVLIYGLITVALPVVLLGIALFAIYRLSEYINDTFD